MESNREECYSNIGLFSIAAHLIIALSALQYQKIRSLPICLIFWYQVCRLVHGFCIAIPIVIALPTNMKEKVVYFLKS